MSHGLIHVYELSVPPLLMLIQSEFGAGDFQMGRVATLYGMLFGLGALPAGWLVDRLGSKPLLLICLWGGSLSLVGMALSPSLVMFAISAAFMGLSLSIYHPAGTALITHSMTPSGRIFALHGMAGNLGVAGASVLAGSLGAIAGVLLGLRALALPSPSLHEIKAREGRGFWTAFALLLVAAIFMGMVYRGMTTFLPKFLAVTYTADATLGTAVGGALTTVALLVGLVGMYTAGRLADGGMRPATVFLIGAVMQVPFFLGIAWTGGSALLPLTMGVAFFHFFTQPVGNQMVADFTPPRLRGLGYGIYFFLAFGAGSTGASLGGWISERYDMATSFGAMALVLLPAIVAMAALVLLVRLRRA
jgi:MFS family permease